LHWRRRGQKVLFREGVSKTVSKLVFFTMIFDYLPPHSEITQTPDQFVVVSPITGEQSCKTVTAYFAVQKMSIIGTTAKRANKAV